MAVSFAHAGCAVAPSSFVVADAVNTPQSSAAREGLCARAAHRAQPEASAARYPFALSTPSRLTAAVSVRAVAPRESMIERLPRIATIRKEERSASPPAGGGRSGRAP